MEKIARVPPRPGQESVWDYPRPPRIEPSRKHIQVVFNGVTIADSRRTQRVLETSHPPVYYIPPEDVDLADCFWLTPRSTYCEFKGAARYYTIVVGDRSAADAAWTYPHPSTGYGSLRGSIAIYPGPMDACFVDGERVDAQPGTFYGGWITRDIVGPIKGGPGTWGW